MTFETLPVVHLDKGVFPEYPSADPDDALTRLARRFGRVVLVDVKGVKANDADLEFLGHAARRRPLWLDAGSRFADDAMDLLVAGAAAVTLRWNTLDRADELAEAAEICDPGTLFLGLEYPRGRFLRHRDDARSDAEAAQLAASLGIGLVFIVDEPTTADLHALPTAMTPRYVQGRHTAHARELGFQGALVPPVDLPPEETA